MDLRCSSHKQLRRYLYGGWRLTEELKLKRIGKRWVVYLTFKRDFDVDPDPRNVVAVDVNENNVTAAVFVGGVLREVWRLETGLGRKVIAYAERRKKITEEHHPSDREVGTKLKRLRERSRKLDVARKAAKFIERLAEEHNALVAVFVASAPTGVHAARATLVNPRLGPTPLAEISTIIDRHR